VAGGAVGAWLLLHTPPDRFARIVPFLVLGATLLFQAQGPIMGRLARRRAAAAGSAAAESPAPKSAASRSAASEYTAAGSAAGSTGDDPRVAPWLFVAGQFAIGVYGGYFGAGIGILMLAGLAMMGFTNIHRMNGLKNWGAVCMNVVAAGIFAFSGIVNWPVAAAIAAGGLLGGYGGSRMAQRVGQQRVRRAIVLIGLASFLFLLFRGL
jgi:uncharacterized membrane protein YfcA